MKLAAIYNVWDGVELLKGSMNCLKNSVDIFIIIYQDVSNFGEHYNPLPEMDLQGFNYILKKHTPYALVGSFNEIIKRNSGLDIAKKEGCTHFVHMDCDEYYTDFAKAKTQYIDSGKNGSVCKLYTYFKKPTWRFEHPDNYYVPFIHKLFPETKAGNKKYPFYVDPTRRINETDVIEIPTLMHHFSWVRNNIERKARNSSSKNNIAKSILMETYFSQELENNPEGYYVKDYGNKITVVENLFSIPSDISSHSL